MLVTESQVGIAWFFEVVFGNVGWDLIFWVTEHSLSHYKQPCYIIPSEIYSVSILNILTFTAPYLLCGKLFQSLNNQPVKTSLQVSSLNVLINRLKPICSFINTMPWLMWMYNIPWVLFPHVLSFLMPSLVQLWSASSSLLQSYIGVVYNYLKIVDHFQGVVAHLFFSAHGFKQICTCFTAHCVTPLGFDHSCFAS